MQLKSLLKENERDNLISKFENKIKQKENIISNFFNKQNTYNINKRNQHISDFIFASFGSPAPSSSPNSKPCSVSCV